MREGGESSSDLVVSSVDPALVLRTNAMDFFGRCHRRCFEASVMLLLQAARLLAS
jgi:hypothetical protein